MCNYVRTTNTRIVADALQTKFDSWRRAELPVGCGTRLPVYRALTLWWLRVKGCLTSPLSLLPGNNGTFTYTALGVEAKL